MKTSSSGTRDFSCHWCFLVSLVIKFDLHMNSFTFRYTMLFSFTQFISRIFCITLIFFLIFSIYIMKRRTDKKNFWWVKEDSLIEIKLIIKRMKFKTIKVKEGKKVKIIRCCFKDKLDKLTNLQELLLKLFNQSYNLIKTWI